MAKQATNFRIWATMSYWDFPRSPVGLRLLLGQTINLFGHRTSLYTSARKEVA